MILNDKITSVSEAGEVVFIQILANGYLFGRQEWETKIGTRGTIISSRPSEGGRVFRFLSPAARDPKSRDPAQAEMGWVVIIPGHPERIGF